MIFSDSLFFKRWAKKKTKKKQNKKQQQQQQQQNPDLSLLIQIQNMF